MLACPAHFRGGAKLRKEQPGSREESAGLNAGTLVGMPTNPSSISPAAGLHQFRAPGSGVDLAANTEDSVVVEISSGAAH